jgi:D-methionine transport system substrate-binding protein
MEPFMVARRAFVALSLAAVALAARGQKPAASSAASDTLTVAATAIPHAEVLEFIKPKLAADGLKIEIKVFNDYVQPNTQVAEKHIDVSYFETLPYLETFNRDKGTHLVPIKGVHIEPMGLYSAKLKSVAEIPQGATIAIPTTPAPRAAPCFCCRATASSP